MKTQETRGTRGSRNVRKSKKDNLVKAKFNKTQEQDRTTKTQDKLDKVDYTRTGCVTANDFKWYWQNPNVAKDAASIPFAQVQGLPMAIEAFNGGDNVISQVTVPGILAVNYIPTIGYADGANADVNVAARLLYTYVRHVNSGSKVYESADYMTYILAVANLHIWYASLVRLYGLLNTTSVLNRYVPRSIINALGYDYDDLSGNLAQLRYHINQLAVKINSFAVPKDFYYYDRATFLPLHVFKDGDNSKSQFYVFVPQVIYKWDGTGETGSRLLAQLTPTGSSGTLEDIIEFSSNLIDDLMSNEDIGIMSGDTLKAFGDNGIRHISFVPADYATIPFKDEGVLAQIHNAMSIGSHNSEWDITITQENGQLINIPKFSLGPTVKYKSVIMDTWLDDPTPEFVMEASRLITMCVPYGGEDFNTMAFSFGTEIITYFSVWDSGGGSFVIQSVTEKPVYDSKLSKFDWAPLIYGFVDGVIQLPAGDLQNYTVVNGTAIQRMHNAALQSLLNVYGLYIKEI